MNCAAWKKAPLNTKVYVKKDTGAIYPVMYLKWQQCDVDFVAEKAKVHLLPPDTIKAFRMTPMTKRHVEREFAAHGGNGYVWVDQHDSTKSFVQLEGSMIVMKEY